MCRWIRRPNAELQALTNNSRVGLWGISGQGGTLTLVLDGGFAPSFSYSSSQLFLPKRVFHQLLICNPGSETLSCVLKQLEVLESGVEVQCLGDFQVVLPPKLPNEIFPLKQFLVDGSAAPPFGLILSRNARKGFFEPKNYVFNVDFDRIPRYVSESARSDWILKTFFSEGVVVELRT